MTDVDFHRLHKAQTPLKQHWKKDGTDEFVNYKYIEKRNAEKSCCVFLPTNINPDDYMILENIMNKALNLEFGNVL